MNRREPRVPRYMATPARDRRPQRPDSAMTDVAAVAWSIVLLLFIYLVAPIVTAHP